MNKRLSFLPITGLVLLTLAGCGIAPNATGANRNQFTNFTTNTSGAQTVSNSTGVTNNATLPTSSTANNTPADTTTPQSDHAIQIALMKNKGYTVDEIAPNATVETASGDTMQAWITTATQSQDGHNHLVFFFLGGKYLGTDTAKPSLEIISAKAAANGIAVTYPVYRTNDSYADPTGTPVTINYAWNGLKLIPNKPYPQQFQSGNSASQGQSSITTTSYSTSTEAANAVASIQGGNGVGAGSSTVNLGNGIIASESAAMGQARYVWQEGNWTIQVRFYTRNSNTAVKQVAENMVTYLHTHALPAPNGDAVIVVESTDSNTTNFQPKTTIAWQEGAQVNELQQTGDPVLALQTVVNQH